MLTMEAVAWWEKIKNRRETLGLSTYAVAKATGLSRGAITGLESGKVKDPRKTTIEAVATALRLPQAELLADVFGTVELTPEERAAYTAHDRDADKLRIWERFAERFQAGDPEVFVERVANLPKAEQAIIERLSRLFDIEKQIG